MPTRRDPSIVRPRIRARIAPTELQHLAKLHRDDAASRAQNVRHAFIEVKSAIAVRFENGVFGQLREKRREQSSVGEFWRVESVEFREPGRDCTAFEQQFVLVEATRSRSPEQRERYIKPFEHRHHRVG